ncbi:hypothetical protein F4782DRAFT_475782 [Xylaria castorea]|nr:hypothetical protein F4782DRAFT_475782 [Xylaria castorea]
MSVGPLTTEFIPAAACISQGLAVVRYSSVTTEGYDYYLLAGPTANSCFPSSQFPSYGSYYSPGRCPSGYSAACSQTGGNSVGNATETTVTCCPMAPYALECNSQSVGGDWGVIGDCTTTTSTLEVDLSIIGAVPSSKLTGSSRDVSGNPILTTPTINGYGIQVRWQETDESLLFSSTSSTPGTTSNPSQPAATSQGVPPKHPNAGEIAGIVVGAVFGVIILLALVVGLIWLKRSQRAKAESQIANGYTNYNGANTERQAVQTAKVSGHETSIVGPKYELPVPAPTGVIPRQELAADGEQRGPKETTQKPGDFLDSPYNQEVLSQPRELAAEVPRSELP